MALLHAIAAKTVREMDGRSPQQRLFISFAQIWCENVSDNWAHFSALTDPHSPGRNRVNGVLQNMPEFQQAFGCSVEQPMVRRPACRVW
jgi:predicted metalloendopeptidase